MLAIIATLVVATAVIVRTFSGRDPEPINIARRRALIKVVQALAIGAVAIALCSAVPYGRTEESIPGAIGLLFVGVIVCVLSLSADARIQFGKIKSSDPRYDAWILQQRYEHKGGGVNQSRYRSGLI